CIFPAHFPSFPEYAEAQKTLLCKFRFFLQFFPLRSRHPRTIHPTLCTYRNAPPFCSILSAVSFHAPTPPEKARHCWKDVKIQHGFLPHTASAPPYPPDAGESRTPAS